MKYQGRNTAQIADALTAEQRQAICKVSSGWPIIPSARGVWILPPCSDRGALNRSIVELGLARYSSFGPALTKAGKDVREYLKDHPHRPLP